MPSNHHALYDLSLIHISMCIRDRLLNALYAQRTRLAGKQQEITMTASSNLSDSEIEQAIREAQEYEATRCV